MGMPPAACARFRLYAFDLAPHVRQEPGFGWASGSDQGASHRVGEIVMRTRRMVDRIASVARRATLEAKELGVQPRHVEEFDTLGVQERKKIAVEVALGLLGRLVGDPVRLEPRATRRRSDRRARW